MSNSRNEEEQSFLLCKPDVQHLHREILEIVKASGLRVVEQSFVVSTHMAKCLAKGFQSVKRLQISSRDEDMGGLGGVAVTKESFPWLDDGRTALTKRGEGSTIIQRRKQVDMHNQIMVDINRLAVRHRHAAMGVNAGLPTAQDGGDEGNDSTTGGPQPAAAGLSSQRVRQHPGVTSTTNLKGRLLESMSYEELLIEHVHHLTCEGTCLAVVLVARGAVNRLLEIIGPEDPVEAKQVAPCSIRARFGTDLVRNAVHAATSKEEAEAYCQIVFGHPLRSPRSAWLTPENGAHTEEVATVPLALADVLPEILSTSPEDRLSYYTGL